MKFATALAFQDPAHFVDMARTADASGWDWFAVSDHILFPENLASPYPYVEGGKPAWDGATPWPDPWIAIAMMAAATARLRFLTNVYLVAARSPFLVAKTVGTAAAMTGDRVALGIGVGWMKEEFVLLGQDFHTRGRRTDEAIEVLRTIWKGGMVEYHGKYYDFDRLQMSPVPARPVPIYVGGASEAALRRAAVRGDGWIAVQHSTRELASYVARLRELREEAGRADEPFEILGACTDAFDIDGYKRLEEIGVTCLFTMPWLFYGGDPASLADKQSALERFARDFIEPLRA